MRKYHLSIRDASFAVFFSFLSSSKQELISVWLLQAEAYPACWSFPPYDLPCSVSSWLSLAILGVAAKLHFLCQILLVREIDSNSFINAHCLER